MPQDEFVRVFILAFSCEPGRGSEPGVGYSTAEAAARLSTYGRFDITLLTRPHTVRLIEKSLRVAEPNHRLTIEPVRIPLWLVAVTKRKRVRIAYIVWQFLAVIKVRMKMAKEIRPCIVHHATFATEALPTFEFILSRRSSIVFGPAGSSQQLNFVVSSNLKARLRYLARLIFGYLNLRGVKVAVATNDSVALLYEKLGAKSVIVEPNIVVPRQLTESIPVEDEHSPLAGHVAICVGILHERKRVHLAIRAISEIHDETVRLLIVGDGPEEDFLRNLVVKLGLESRVSFAGRLNRSDTLSVMRSAKVLVHPSRQEGSSWVIGEAQSVGTVPVVVRGSGCEATVRLGGLGVVVDNNAAALATGILNALSVEGIPSMRWSGERLPDTFASWYENALS